MPRLFKRLLYTLAAATDNELRKQIQFLKAENEILRRRLQKRVVLTTAERARLVKFGRPLGRPEGIAHCCNLQHLDSV